MNINKSNLLNQNKNLSKSKLELIKLFSNVFSLIKNKWKQLILATFLNEFFLQFKFIRNDIYPIFLYWKKKFLNLLLYYSCHSFWCIEEMDLKFMKWGPAEPNNWGNQDCVGFFLDFGIHDTKCSTPKYPVCKFKGYIQYTLDGVCKMSMIDSHFVLKPDGRILGLRITEMIRNTKENQWEIRNLLNNETIAKMNSSSGFPFGTNKWYFVLEDCRDPSVDWRLLNFHLKVDRPGMFCCEDGVCIDSELVCNGDWNCADKSDEQTCQLIVTDEHYRKEQPPKQKVNHKKYKLENEYLYKVLLYVRNTVCIPDMCMYLEMGRLEIKFGSRFCGKKYLQEIN